MRILYGVQATGNGHIARARVLARAFSGLSTPVDYLLSGRDPKLLFGTEIFGDFEVRRGLTFCVERGAINYWKTALKLPIARAVSDISRLDLRRYDLVISDFEPISAWAARIKGVPSLGISHQCAFRYGIPKAENNFVASSVLKAFAPVDYAVGLHWSSFGFPILPPLIDLDPAPPHAESENDVVLVYLPFEDPAKILSCLNQCGDTRFVAYVGLDPSHSSSNVICRPYDKPGFQKDLLQCSGVICNAGFELPSECIQLGKRLLVKPVRGQMEQASNARALTELRLGHCTDNIDTASIRRWLGTSRPRPVNFGDVAGKIVEWINAGDFTAIRELSRSAWRGIDMPVPFEAS